MIPNRTFIMFGMYLDSGEPDDIRSLLETIRRSTPNRTSEVIHLTGNPCPSNLHKPWSELSCNGESVRMRPCEILYFTYEEDAFGFARYPETVEVAGQSVPTCFKKWTWAATIDPIHSEPFTAMLDAALSLGVEIIRHPPIEQHIPKCRTKRK